MLEHITWGQYLTSVAICAGGYYLIVALRHYRKEIKGMFDKTEIGKDRAVDVGDRSLEEEEDEGFEDLEDLVNGIRSGILEKAGEDATKEELLESIRSAVASYGGLHKPAFRYALTNFIIQQAMVICGVAISEEELAGVWESLPR